MFTHNGSQSIPLEGEGSAIDLITWLYVDLRTEFGTLYGDQLFADLFASCGCPVVVAPALGPGDGDVIGP